MQRSINDLVLLLINQHVRLRPTAKGIDVVALVHMCSNVLDGPVGVMHVLKAVLEVDGVPVELPIKGLILPKLIVFAQCSLFVGVVE